MALGLTVELGTWGCLVETYCGSLTQIMLGIAEGPVVAISTQLPWREMETLLPREKGRASTQALWLVLEPHSNPLDFP